MSTVPSSMQNGYSDSSRDSDASNFSNNWKNNEAFWKIGVDNDSIFDLCGNKLGLIIDCVVAGNFWKGRLIEGA